MTATGQKLTDEYGAFPPDIGNAIYSYRGYEVLLSIAENYAAAGNFSDAVNILKDAVVQMEKTPPQKDYLQYTAYNALGLGLFNLGDIKSAINSIETSIKIAPSQPNLDVSYANLGMLYFKQGDNMKAQYAIDKALTINPNNTSALDYQKKLEGSLGR